MTNPWVVILKSRFDDGAITESFVHTFVTKGKITEEEYVEITT